MISRMINSRLILMYISLLLTISAIGAVIYELNKPDFTIEHTGIIVTREQTDRGCLLSFQDGYVILLSEGKDVCNPLLMPLRGYVTIVQGRSNFIYYEQIFTDPLA